MPKGQLYINNVDAFVTWGVSLDDAALSALLAPSNLKEYAKDDYRLNHGTDYIVEDTRVAERSLTLTLNLIANSEAQFFSRLASFCAELEKGELSLRTAFESNKTYHLIYQRCTQFTQFQRGIAKFVLQVVEPNPKNRA